MLPGGSVVRSGAGMAGPAIWDWVGCVGCCGCAQLVVAGSRAEVRAWWQLCQDLSRLRNRTATPCCRVAQQHGGFALEVAALALHGVAAVLLAVLCRLHAGQHLFPLTGCGWELLQAVEHVTCCQAAGRCWLLPLLRARQTKKRVRRRGSCDVWAVERTCRHACTRPVLRVHERRWCASLVRMLVRGQAGMPGHCCRARRVVRRP